MIQLTSNDYKTLMGCNDIDQLKMLLLNMKDFNIDNTDDINNYLKLKTWGFSENLMYEAREGYKKGDRLDKLRTDGYNQWCKIFKDQMNLVKHRINIDTTKPIELYLKFDHNPRFDVSNYIKAVQDNICLFLGFDDNLIVKVVCSTNKHIDKPNDGRVYFMIKNVN